MTAHDTARGGTGARPLIILAAGGTGGHVFPAEALAGVLDRRGYRLALVTDRRGESYGGTLGSLENHQIRAGGIAGKSLLARFRSVPELALGTLQARTLLRRLKPRVVVGFGGYASVPTMLAAAFADCRTALHEQNAVLGRANRLLAGRADRIGLSFEDTRGLPEGARARSVHTGMPVRPAVAALRDTAYPALDDAGPIHVLVVGGSQGARVLSDVVPAGLRMLPDRVRRRLRIVQQCRPEDLERVGTAYLEAGLEAELAAFFDDLPARLAACHLVIGRAGASSIAEITAIGRPAVLVPYPHAIDDHQRLNAHAIDAVGGGWLMPQDTFTAAGLARRLDSLLGLPAILTKGAAASRPAGRPDAGERLADMVEALVAADGNGDGDDNGDRAPERRAA